MRRLYLLVQYLPLTVFVAYARAQGFTPQAWQDAFILGGSLALCESLALGLARARLDRLLLGANLFLVFGAAAFLGHIGWLLSLYAAMMTGALFASVIIVGVISTFLTRGGFIGEPLADHRATRIHSLYLLAASVAALVASLFFQSNVILGGMIPFVFLLVCRRQLRKSPKGRRFLLWIFSQ